MMTRILLLFVLLLTYNLVSAQAGVPGTTGTLSGYDTELGTDPVCWTGSSVDLAGNLSERVTITPFPNPLVQDFHLLGNTKLLLECPKGVKLDAFAPKEFGTPPDYNDGIRPRTKQWYNFTVQFTINLVNVTGSILVSDNTTSVAVQVSDSSVIPTVSVKRPILLTSIYSRFCYVSLERLDSALPLSMKKPMPVWRHRESQLQQQEVIVMAGLTFTLRM
jgi:hypothetical protein